MKKNIGAKAAAKAALLKTGLTTAEFETTNASVRDLNGAMTIRIDGDELLLSPAEVQQLDVIQEIGHKIIIKTGEVGILYRSLVAYLRQQLVSVRIYRWKLLAMGFHKVRVSEICRVASLPDDLYTEYQGAKIGFDKAVMLARMSGTGKPEMTPAAMAMISNSGEGKPVVDVDAVVKEVESEDGDGKNPKTKTTASIRMMRAAATIFKNAKKAKSWSSGDGWELNLVKAKAKAVTE